MAQMRGLKGYRKVILALTGAILIVFGALWMTTILPSLSKVPTDLNETQSFVGTFQVADQTGALGEPIPVSQTRQQTAVGTETGNVLLIEEVCTVVNSVTGDDLSLMYGGTEIIAIDRSSLEMVSEFGDMPRQGQWSPPKSVGAGDSFLIWNPAAGTPLEANYIGSEKFRGLDVVVFQVNEENLALGTEEMEVSEGLFMTLDKYLTTDITIRFESATGVVVDTDSYTMLSYGMPGMEPVPAFISNLSFTEDTIAFYVETAKDSSMLLFIFSTVIPWTAIGFGAILVITPAMIVAARRLLKKSKVDKPTELPKPTSLPLDI